MLFGVSTLEFCFTSFAVIWLRQKGIGRGCLYESQ